MLIKGFMYFALRASGLRLISFMELDCRKGIHSVKSAWSICIQSLKPASYPLSSGVIKDIKRTHLHPHRHFDGVIFEVLYVSRIAV